MRLFIAEIHGKNHLALAHASGNLYLLDELGYSFCSAEAFIRNASPEQQFALKKLAQSKKISDYHAYRMDGVIIHSPVTRPAQDIICLGVNYYDHAQELTRTETVSSIASESTIYFSKRVNYAVGDGESISSHSDIVKELDYEAELLVILKKDAYKVSEEEAENYIFGYSVMNDVSARDLQKRHKQWYLGKSLDGFTAIGPCIVTADEIENAQNLEISCTVNGEVRQKSNTSLMIKSIRGAIAELSAGMKLSAGTMIATGTPGGVGKGMTPPQYLKHGDVVSCQIEGIGSLTNVID